MPVHANDFVGVGRPGQSTARRRSRHQQTEARIRRCPRPVQAERRHAAEPATQPHRADQLSVGSGLRIPSAVHLPETSLVDLALDGSAPHAAATEFGRGDQRRREETGHPPMVGIQIPWAAGVPLTWGQGA